PQRRALLDALGDAVDALGGTMTYHYSTVLGVAKRGVCPPPYHPANGRGSSPAALRTSGVSQIAEQARGLGLRLLSRRWDDPPHTIETMDSAIAELAAMRRVAVDSEDEQALREVLEEIAEMRRELVP